MTIISHGVLFEWLEENRKFYERQASLAKRAQQGDPKVYVGWATKPRRWAQAKRDDNFPVRDVRYTDDPEEVKRDREEESIDAV